MAKFVYQVKAGLGFIHERGLRIREGEPFNSNIRIQALDALVEEGSLTLEIDGVLQGEAAAPVAEKEIPVDPPVPSGTEESIEKKEDEAPAGTEPEAPVDSETSDEEPETSEVGPDSEEDASKMGETPEADEKDQDE